VLAGAEAALTAETYTTAVYAISSTSAKAGNDSIDDSNFSMYMYTVINNVICMCRNIKPIPFLKYSLRNR